MPAQIIPALEFQSLPLEIIVSAPLDAAIKAQSQAANTTLSFIKSMMEPGANAADPWGLKTVDLKYSYMEQPPAPQPPAAGGPAPPAPPAVQKNVTLSVPLLAITPIPHLRIDSVTINFKYEVTQVVADKSKLDMGISLDASTGAALSPFVSASLKGNVSSSESHEATTNRSGVLDITVHASESPIPEGLARLLSLMAKVVEPKVT